MMMISASPLRFFLLKRLSMDTPSIFACHPAGFDFVTLCRDYTGIGYRTI
jgi:hypothetical protein